MKIFLLLFSLLILIAGCSSAPQKKVMNEKNISSDSIAYNDSDVVNKINAIKNSETQEAAPNQESGQSGAQGEQAKQQVQLENLIAEFNQAIIKTNFGDIKVEFYGQESPLTVNNFLNLAKIGFYNNTKFHRVMKDFMIQGGDPNSKDDDWSNDGTGGPGYSFQDEFNSHKLVRGSLAMANSGPNTNGSQFFIVTSEATPWLDNKHTNFGYVVEGMDIVEKIEAVEVNEQDHPVEDVVVESMELAK